MMSDEQHIDEPKAQDPVSDAGRRGTGQPAVRIALRTGDVAGMTLGRQRRILRYFVRSGRTVMVRKVGEQMGFQFGEEVRERRFPRPLTYWPFSWFLSSFREKRTSHEGEKLVEDTPQIHKTIRFWRNIWSGIKLGAVLGVIGGLVAWHYATVDFLGETRIEEPRAAAMAEIAEDENILIRGIRLPFEGRKERIKDLYKMRLAGATKALGVGLEKEMLSEVAAVAKEEKQAVQDYLNRTTRAAQAAFAATRNEEDLTEKNLRRRAGLEAMGWNLETVKAVRDTFTTARVRAIQVAGVLFLFPLLSALTRRRVRAGAAVARTTRRMKKRLKKKYGGR